MAGELGERQGTAQSDQQRAQVGTFACITRPEEARKSLLENARIILVALRSYYALADLRKQKRRHLEDLAKELLDLNGFVRQLTADLPLRQELKQPATDSQISRIESALRDLGQRLDTM